jgi:hypothetical protein
MSALCEVFSSNLDSAYNAASCSRAIVFYPLGNEPGTYLEKFIILVFASGFMLSVSLLHAVVWPSLRSSLGGYWPIDVFL